MKNLWGSGYFIYGSNPFAEVSRHHSGSLFNIANKVTKPNQQDCRSFLTPSTAKVFAFYVQLPYSSKL
jgi:mannose-1-phosphate guanylyltransferase